MEMNAILMLRNKIIIFGKKKFKSKKKLYFLHTEAHMHKHTLSYCCTLGYNLIYYEDVFLKRLVFT